MRVLRNSIYGLFGIFILGILFSQFLSLIQKNENRKPHFIYMYQSDVENGFDREGKQTMPLSMFAEPKNIASIMKVIKESGLFLVDETQIEGCIILRSIVELN
jgi:hypothetical protein